MDENTEMSQVVQVSLEQLERCIRVAWSANVPVAMWSKPGFAKSSLVAQIAASLRWDLYDVRLSLYEPSDLGGIPYPAGAKYSMLAPDWLPFESIIGEKPCVLFLDEFDRSEPQMQNVALQLIQDRRVHNNNLGPGVRLALAGNGTTDSMTFGLSEAAATRMAHLYVDVGSDGTQKSWQRWAARNGISPALRAFGEYRWSEFHNGGGADYRVLAKLNLRTAAMADRLLNMSSQVRQMNPEFKVEDIELALAAGCIGRGPAVQYLAIRRAHASIADLDAILASPETAKIPTELSELYALTQAMLDRVRGENAGAVAARVVKYARRLPDEIGMATMRQLTERHPAIVTDVNYLAWCQAQLD